ncbi:TIM-barrel domain-containing protein [Heliomicrobium undosum]|uniref:TIM-barrel domain-containing protein n=1 Tax=Heliomicrobium undosum TaxID=121734 RepID=UPI001F3295ED|nr:TIM-barrel domain-containing protein [Heliomicrobium undosum]
MLKTQAFRFVRVEQFFEGCVSWNSLDSVIGAAFDGQKSISLFFQRADGKTCVMLLQFPRMDTFRLRFGPDKEKPEDYPKFNTRSIVTDTFSDLHRLMEPFSVDVDMKSNIRALHIITKDSQKVPYMKLVVQYSPFSITAYKLDPDGPFPVLSTATPAIYYTENGLDGYSVIQSFQKRATAKFIGFGEHGGLDLSKNTAQLTFFNYDNMRYRQVYNRGPLENREPLYHSDPFFMEFFGVPDKENVCGFFIDNPSQVCMDIGFLNSSRYMFGSRFGDLDYYFFLGRNCSDVLDAFTSLVGKARLKPRYALGYHQGRYGMEDRNAVETLAREYREYQIPIDGLHIDVDIQRKHKTFTIDHERFPAPKEMFAGLRSLGYKCSTNITPIISNQDPDESGDPDHPRYDTYYSGKEKNYFVVDKRIRADKPDAKTYYCYQGGEEHSYTLDSDAPFNDGAPYIGEVNYGHGGTTGNYPDFGKREVRDWWGEQYQTLFDMGLEMVWQDMTTPCIDKSRGDMLGFPSRLLVTDDFTKAYDPEDSTSLYQESPAFTVWNLYSYNLHKATYHGLNHLRGRENKRNFIIGRGCFSGMHRFAALWTGDNASEWDFLRINVAQVLSLGLTGQAICGQDIGGFEPKDNEQWADPELLIRWTAAGAFLPWFRNHYIAKDNIKLFQEPYAYQQLVDAGKVAPNEAPIYSSVLPVCKYYIELRYRLMQLFYDAMFENTLNGMPICRPLFLTDEQDEALLNDKLVFINNQFMVRNDLLIAPVLEKQSQENSFGKRQVYLPAGSRWYSYMDNRRPLQASVEGGTTIGDFDASINADSNHIGFIVPMYVRHGAVIPTIELEQYVGERNEKGLPNPITLNIYPGADGEYTMYLDDGVSRSSAPAGDPNFGADPQAKSEYRETRITHRYNGRGKRLVRIERLHDGYTPKMEKHFFVAILHDPAEAAGANGCLRSVTIGASELPCLTYGSTQQRASQLSTAGENGWYYNEDLRISFIKVFDVSALIEMELVYNE